MPIIGSSSRSFYLGVVTDCIGDLYDSSLPLSSRKYSTYYADPQKVASGHPAHCTDAQSQGIQAEWKTYRFES